MKVGVLCLLLHGAHHDKDEHIMRNPFNPYTSSNEQNNEIYTEASRQF